LSYDNFVTCLTTCPTTNSTMFVNWAPEQQPENKTGQCHCQ